MRTLFVKDPWAWLIVHGYKPIENRSRRVNVRGPLLIGASAKMTRGDYEACAIFCSGLPEGTFPPDFQFPTFEELLPQLGGIVGRVDLVDCVEQSDSPWFVGDYGWVLANPKLLPFVKCKGHQGFFNFEYPEILNQSAERIGARRKENVNTANDSGKSAARADSPPATGYAATKRINGYDNDRCPSCGIWKRATAETCRKCSRKVTTNAKAVNHMYRDMPARVGSVAECGHVKASQIGFMDGADTCSKCVAAVVGPRLKVQRHTRGAMPSG